MDNEVLIEENEELVKNDDFEKLKDYAKEAIIDGVTVFSFSWIAYQISKFLKDTGGVFQKVKGYFK